MKPKACASCHNAYWDRPAKWTRKGRAERIRINAEKKIAKKIERANRRDEFRKKLENAFSSVIQEAEASGEDVSKQTKRKAKSILKQLQQNGNQAKVQETSKPKTIYEKTMDILGGMDKPSSPPVAESIPDAVEEVFQGKAFRIVAPSIPIGYTIIDNQEVQVGQSDAVGVGTDTTD